MLPLPLNLTGAAHLNSPVGGFANGMPKYSETCVLSLAACPFTAPLVVLIACPTFQVVLSSGGLPSVPKTNTMINNVAHNIFIKSRGGIKPYVSLSKRFCREISYFSFVFVRSVYGTERLKLPMFNKYTTHVNKISTRAEHIMFSD
jgi:hypothetical protein